MNDECGYRGWFGGAGRDVPEDLQLPAVRSGVDEFAAVFWASIFAIGTSVSLGMAIYHGSSMWLIAALGGWLAGVVAATCTRWRIRVSREGVEYRRWECGIPVQRKEFLLDVEISLYESWEADSPEGIEIRDPRGEWEDTTGCFGPYSSEAAQLELLAWLAAALKRARAAVETRVDGMRCAELEGKMDAVRPTKWGPNGEVREARTTAELTFSGVMVPEGSTLLFNDDRPVRDPRRDDTLSGVRLSAEVVLPNGFELRRGVLVNFIGERVWVHENGQGREHRDGVVYYAEDVMFDADWEPTRFTLADSVVVDGFEIPAESDVSRMRALSPRSFWFSVTLAESVRHEEARYERGRAVFFDSSKRFMRPDSPRLVDATFDPDLQSAGDMEI